MRVLLTYSGIAVVCAVFIGSLTGEATAQNSADGKKIYMDNKCNACHSITAQSIPVKKVEGEEKNEKDPPDLSSVGLERNADWISKYLMKKEAIKGEKHSKKFKGSEGDLSVLAQFLEAQKTKPKK